MIISKLSCKTIISPNKSKRTREIDTITIHVVDGNSTVEALGNRFAQKSVQASSNYGIGSDGRIACYVPEDYRSWCSSSSSNDNRAITIEVANDGPKSTGYHVSDKAVASLINLLVDICQRYPKLKGGLRWQGNKALIGQIDKQNMTVHRWFKNKACPGDYLYNLHPYIASEVNKRLGTATAPIPANGNYVWQGVDWSPVFNPTYYYNTYKDLQSAIGNDSNKLFNHFTTFGMNESRQAISTFNVKAYKARYKDLQNAFGDNMMQYYWHYCVFGKNEGRTAT